jgi:hypothetical protein
MFDSNVSRRIEAREQLGERPALILVTSDHDIV